MASTRTLRSAARAIHRADADSAEARKEGFELAQWALQTGAADALAQMALRFAKGAGQLAQLVRQRQDLIARRQGEMTQTSHRQTPLLRRSICRGALCQII